MSKLVMLRGLPASGKTTYALELVSQGYGRVNRDEIRDMLEEPWSPNLERRVVSIESSLISNWIRNGKDVVIDDCNLNPSNEDMWRELAQEEGAEFEVVPINTSIQECIWRDERREKKVGKHVIQNMALKYDKVNIANKVVICDIDGTIADIEHRRHHVNKSPKDWKSFFAEMDKDTVRKDVLKMLKEASGEGKQIIFVSARPEDYIEVTDKWLQDAVEQAFDYFLIMRKKSDTRDDAVVKREIFQQYLSDLNIDKVIDDRPKVIRMWRSLGLPVIDVGDGIEF